MTDSLQSIAKEFSIEGFGLDHLPYASFSAPGAETPAIGTRIGNYVVPLATVLAQQQEASPVVKRAAETHNLDVLLEAGRPAWEELRSVIQNVLTDATSAESLKPTMHAVTDVILHLPFTVGDYVDFYGNEYHASNVGHIFRPGQPPLTANWKHIPIGYHGRSNTIIPSGTDISRPKGMRPEQDAPPTFGPSRRLDIEAEVGFVLGGAAPSGEVSLAQAKDHIFGLTLTNDWSARDIQAFEYVPLGPNLGKSFATSVAPWVTPVEALRAARTAPPRRDTPLADYLDDTDEEQWGFDLKIEILLNGETVSRPPFSSTYWTAAQMLAHMTVNGASLHPGDFFAGGTVSGPEKDQRGSFLELSWGGKEPLVLIEGTEYTFLQDGDEVTLRATAPGPNGTIIQLGDCSGRVCPPTNRNSRF